MRDEHKNNTYSQRGMAKKKIQTKLFTPREEWQNNIFTKIFTPNMGWQKNKHKK